jgi:Fe-Mn family superoxide dismutase
MNYRRDFLKKSALLAFTTLGTSLIGKDKINTVEELLLKTGDGGKYTLPALPYAYDALEPFIDKQTMEIHHTKHHQSYVDKLNAELEKADPKILQAPYSFENIFKVASKVQPALRNNAGGHYNHSLFWQLLKPNPESKVNVPGGKLGEAINKDFKSFDEFKKEFSEKAVKIFGSGWCWLIEQNGKLKITTTPNQDNPVMDLEIEKGKIIMGLDVWEHAYYLKYQNKRADYISNWWNVANWEKATELFNNK